MIQRCKIIHFFRLNLNSKQQKSIFLEYVVGRIEDISLNYSKFYLNKFYKYFGHVLLLFCSSKISLNSILKRIRSRPQYLFLSFLKHMIFQKHAQFLSALQALSSFEPLKYKLEKPTCINHYR